jgi:hypothetical protein
MYIGRHGNGRKVGNIKRCADDIAGIGRCVVAHGIVVNHQKTGSVHAQTILIIVPKPVVNIPYRILIAGNLHRPPLGQRTPAIEIFRKNDLLRARNEWNCAKKNGSDNKTKLHGKQMKLK